MTPKHETKGAGLFIDTFGRISVHKRGPHFRCNVFKNTGYLIFGSSRLYGPDPNRLFVKPEVFKSSS